jgi:hypothetical protein
LSEKSHCRGTWDLEEEPQEELRRGSLIVRTWSIARCAPTRKKFVQPFMNWRMASEGRPYKWERNPRVTDLKIGHYKKIATIDGRGN